MPNDGVSINSDQQQSSCFVMTPLIRLNVDNFKGCNFKSENPDFQTMGSSKLKRSLRICQKKKKMVQDPIPLSLEQQRTYEGKVFPLVISPPSEDFELSLWFENNKDNLDNLLRQHRAILFRGFANINSPEDFHNAVEATEYLSMDYVGGAAVRTQLTPRVFTANESPPSEIIPYHHEMAQTPHPPTHLFFFCEIPPAEGGETPILISNEIYEKVRTRFPDFITDIETHGVHYIRVMSEEDDPISAIGRGWKSTFLCEEKGKL
jgi:hypothetical protein